MRIFITFTLLIVSITIANANGRYALVIGNSNYQAVSKLKNPQNDAADVSAAFKRLGFEVTTANNLDFGAMRRELGKFNQRTIGAEMAVIFYAGHGIEVNKQNYLIPTDAELKTDSAISFETIPLELMTEAVSGAKGLKLVMLDSCRNNPFASQMKISNSKRSIGRGLAPVEPSIGTLVTFAAKEGTTADDGEGRNSPYTKALLEHLEEPGLEINFLFRKIRDSVLQETAGRQMPFTYGSLSGERIYLNNEPAESVANDRFETSRSNKQQLELALWDAVKQSDNIEEIQSYLDQFPSGAFTVVARNKLAKLSNTEEKVTSANQRKSIAQDPDTIVIPDSARKIGDQEVKLIQEKLARYGAGTADGKIGKNTTRAIQAYQVDWELPPTGKVSADLFARLERTHPATAPRFRDTGRDGCQIWSALPQAQEKVSWSGECMDGKVQGAGTAEFRYVENGITQIENIKASYENGRISGHAEINLAGKYLYEGTLDDKSGILDGLLTIYTDDGNTIKHTIRNGESIN